MRDLIIKQAEDVPEINFKSTGALTIIGNSYPEDTYAIYQPAITWIKEYLTNPADSTTISFNTQYFNSSSYKVFLNFMMLLASVKNLTIEWCYLKDDDDLLEAGKEFEQIVEFPFTFTAK